MEDDGDFAMRPASKYRDKIINPGVGNSTLPAGLTHLQNNLQFRKQVPGSGFVPPMIVNCFVRHRLCLEYDRVAQGGREGFECVQAVQEGILCCGRFAGARYDCSFKWLICLVVHFPRSNILIHYILLIDHFIYCSDIDDNMHGLGPVQKRKNISFATCNRIVQISKQLIKVEVAGGFADAAAELLRRVSFLYLQDMAQYIPAADPGGLFEKGDYMHSEKWLLILINLITVGSRCHNVGHPRVSFGQICREVHFLPSEFLFALYSRKPEVRAQSAPFYEI